MHRPKCIPGLQAKSRITYTSGMVVRNHMRTEIKFDLNVSRLPCGPAQVDRTQALSGGSFRHKHLQCQESSDVLGVCVYIYIYILYIHMYVYTYIYIYVDTHVEYFTSLQETSLGMHPFQGKQPTHRASRFDEHAAARMQHLDSNGVQGQRTLLVSGQSRQAGSHMGR